MGHWRNTFGLALLNCFFAVSSAYADVLWSESFDGFILSLQEEPKDSFHFTVRTEQSARRTVSFKTGEKKIAIKFPESTLAEKSISRIPSNPLVKSVRLTNESIQVRLMPKAWDQRRVQETSSSFIVSARFKKEKFLIDAFASKGKAAPVLKVWDAKVKKRKVIPVPMVRMTEEDLAAEALPEQEVILEKVDEEDTADVTPVEGAVAAQKEEGGIVPQEPNFESVSDLSLSNPDESMKASFLGEAGGADISLRPREKVVIVGSPMSLRLRNDGLGKALVRFEVKEEKFGTLLEKPTSELTVSPQSVELFPSDEATVTLSFVRPTLKQERVFRVFILDQQGDSSKRVGDSRFFIQPRGGVARVAWTRDEKGITFVNNGNISSRFVDIEVCDGACKEIPDLLLYPSQEKQLDVAGKATITLTQIVGSNRRTGTIPEFQQ